MKTIVKQQQNTKPKLIRVAAVPMSLRYLLKGQLAFLAAHFEVIAVASAGADLDVVSRREQVATKAINIAREIHLLKDIKALWQLYRYFKTTKPQLVHSITPKAGLLSMTAAYFAGVPVRIHTFTGLLFPSKKGLFRYLLITMDKLLCYFATHIIPEGQGVKNDLLEYKITSKPLEILANGNINGIDLNYYSATNLTKENNQEVKEKWHINANDFVFLFVGRLVSDKGINELVAAFNELNTTHQNIKLILVGIEEKTDRLTVASQALIKSNTNIIRTGWQEDVRPFMQVSDVFVFPSYREGFPNVVLQAGAMGLPQIVTNINGANEIITNQINGLIIPPKDTNALYQAMKQLHNDRQLTAKLAENARAIIASNYEQKQVWQALLAYYQKVNTSVVLHKS